MEVELVGTGAIYTRYNSACTLINKNMLVDIPNGTLKQLLKNNYQPENIKTILITHMHGDHIADLPFLLKYIFGFLKKDSEIIIIGPKGIESKVIQLFASYNFENKEEIEQTMKLRYIEIDKKSIVLENINGDRINAIQVSHAEEKPAYGYIINNELGFTGDSEICEGVENIVESSKITIADTSLIEGNEAHMGINDILYLLNKYKKTIIATHLRDKTREKLLSSNIENLLVVEDGYKFEVTQ